jgi:hypothetical protein
MRSERSGRRRGGGGRRRRRSEQEGLLPVEGPLRDDSKVLGISLTQNSFNRTLFVKPSMNRLNSVINLFDRQRRQVRTGTTAYTKEAK